MSGWGLDTSVVLRLLTGEPPKQAARAKQFLLDVEKAEETVFVSDLVVAEAYYALVFHYRVPKREARRQLLSMLTSRLVRAEPDGVAVEALVDARSGRVGVVDQLIRRRYVAYSAETVTFDRLLGKLPGTKLLEQS